MCLRLELPQLIDSACLPRVSANRTNFLIPYHAVRINRAVLLCTSMFCEITVHQITSRRSGFKNTARDKMVLFTFMILAALTGE